MVINKDETTARNMEHIIAGQLGEPAYVVRNSAPPVATVRGSSISDLPEATVVYH